LNRAIQKYLEDPLAEFILNNQAQLSEGTTLGASLDEKENMVINIVLPEKTKSKKKE
jgi:ATP-dependent Clp protease ATP-binding subunit ClpC